MVLHKFVNDNVNTKFCLNMITCFNYYHMEKKNLGGGGGKYMFTKGLYYDAYISLLKL